jgi:hypothetical protein
MENLKHRKRPIQEEAQKLKFYNSHQNQITRQIFDGWTHSFLIGSLIWFYLSPYKIWKSIWVQVSDLFNHRLTSYPGSVIEILVWIQLIFTISKHWRGHILNFWCCKYFCFEYVYGSSIGNFLTYWSNERHLKALCYMFLLRLVRLIGYKLAPSSCAGI